MSDTRRRQPTEITRSPHAKAKQDACGNSTLGQTRREKAEQGACKCAIANMKGHRQPLHLYFVELPVDASLHRQTFGNLEWRERPRRLAVQTTMHRFPDQRHRYRCG